MFSTGLNNGAQAVALTERLPMAYFCGPGIVALKFGGFARTLRFRGGDAGSMSGEELEAAMGRLHEALRRVRGQLSMLIEGRRVPAPDYPGAGLPERDKRRLWPDPVSYLYDEERREGYGRAGARLESDRTITFVWKCGTAASRRARGLFMRRRPRPAAEAAQEMREFIHATDVIKGMLDGVMKECAWLGDEDTFDYYHKTVSTHRHRVRPSFGKARIDYDIADCRLVGGVDPMLGDCFLRVVTVKNTPDTVPAALADLDALPFEHRCTLRWIGLEHAAGLRKIQAQLTDWNMLGVAMVPMLISYLLKSDRQTTNVSANAMAEDAADALHAARLDDLTIGWTNLNVIVWDRDQAALDRKVQAVTDLLNRHGLTLRTYGIATLDTWLGCVPGHIYADPRRPIRTSVNLAHLMSYSSVWSGDKWCARLGGPAAIVATTDGSTPFFLSLHRGDLSHTLVLGPSGSGKTTLLNALCLGWRRYRRSRICLFTIKGGGEILTRMLGGVSYQVGEIGGDALGFQPLAHADEPNERVELMDWLLDLLRAQRVAVDTAVRDEIAAALADIAANPPERRTLTHLSSYVNTPAVKAALRHYALDGGTYGRLLDDDRDRIALSDVLSLDMTELLKKKEIAPHVLSHLFRYIERRIFTGDPVLLIVDEAWRFLGDALFTARFDEWLRAARSRNVTVVFATQNMKDAFDDTIGKVLADAENVPNIILLPNERAASEKGRRLYEKLGFHERDIQIVAGAVPKKHYYFTCPAGRRLFDLGLGPLGRLLCATTDEADVKAARRIHAQSPGEFRERYLEARGLTWMADFIRQEKGARPGEAAAAAD